MTTKVFVQSRGKGSLSGINFTLEGWDGGVRGDGMSRNSPWRQICRLDGVRGQTTGVLRDQEGPRTKTPTERKNYQGRGETRSRLSLRSEETPGEQRPEKGIKSIFALGTVYWYFLIRVSVKLPTLPVRNNLLFPFFPLSLRVVSFSGRSSEGWSV